MAEAFHQDLTCSICLDLFVEPVLLSCGHCFCKKCILSLWGNQERASSCPECREPCPDRQCTPSRLLGNLAKKAWDMRHETNSGTLPNTTEISDKEEREVEREEGQHKVLCEVHGESLELFCTIDEIPICCRCINSSVHAGHSFVSLKDGAQSCKSKLAKALEPLEKRIKELEELEGSQQEKIHSLKDLATSLRTNTETIFSELLHQILYQRQAEMLAELDKDEKNAHKDMADHLGLIQEKLSAVKKVVTEGKSFMELNNLSSFLLGVRPLLEKLVATKATHCEEDKDGLKVLHRNLCLGKFKGPIRHLACRPLLLLFAQGLQPVQLDCNTAHPLLKITNKETRVIPSMVKNTPFKMLQEYAKNQYWTVFAKNGFLSGRHYWEMEVEGEAVWWIGVAVESMKGKNVAEHLKSKVWVVRVSREKGISVRAGVYLDYEEGQVSFYRASDGSHVCTQMVQFKEKVYPFFCNIATEPFKDGSLTICQKYDS